MDGTPRAAELEAGDLTVSCHVRAPMLLEPVDAHVETLRRCAAEGAIDELVLRSWPDQVRRSPESPEQDAIERFEAFSAWADRASVDVQPPFETRTRTSMVSGAETDLLVLPLCCLALYDEAGGLVGVYPHSADGETRTVEDAIASLQSGAVPVPLSAAPARVERGDLCPECAGLLVNGQGLYSCPDCAWVGTADADGGFEPLPPIRAGGPVAVSVAPGAGSDAGDESDHGTVASPDEAGDARGREADASTDDGAAGTTDLDAARATAGLGAVTDSRDAVAGSRDAVSDAPETGTDPVTDPAEGGTDADRSASESGSDDDRSTVGTSPN